jgi:hypothetical protein
MFNSLNLGRPTQALQSFFIYLKKKIDRAPIKLFLIGLLKLSKLTFASPRLIYLKFDPFVQNVGHPWP